MPHIIPGLVPVPVPDRVAVLMGSQIPKHVLNAECDAEDAAYRLRHSGGPLTRKAREVALSDVARANKVLAAWNPRLMATPRSPR